MFWNILWLVINGSILVSLTITANVWRNFPIPTFFPFPDSTLEKVFPKQVHQLASFRGISTTGSSLTLADLPIVQDIYILNYVVCIILACGIVSLFLIFWQLVKEYKQLRPETERRSLLEKIEEQNAQLKFLMTWNGNQKRTGTI